MPRSRRRKWTMFLVGYGGWATALLGSYAVAYVLGTSWWAPTAVFSLSVVIGVFASLLGRAFDEIEEWEEKYYQRSHWLVLVCVALDHPLPDEFLDEDLEAHLRAALDAHGIDVEIDPETMRGMITREEEI